MRSYAAFNHKDGNHRGIVSELESRGVEVVELMQPVDLLARLGDFVAFLEVKQPGSRARWTRTQLQFIANTRFPVGIVTSADEAWQVLTGGKALLTLGQKDRIQVFLMKTNDKFFTPKEIAEVLG